MTPPSPAPPQAPPPTPPAWAPSSPFYAPTQQQTTRRLPLGLIAGAVVALLILMTGVGLVAAAIAKGGAGSSGGTATATASPQFAPPTAVPTPSQPVASPIPTPTGAATGAGACNSALCVNPPAGWTIASKDDMSFVLGHDNPAGSSLVESVKLGSPAKPVDLLQTLVNSAQKKYPDVSVCQNVQVAGIGGKDGQYVILCYTATPQGGQAVKVERLIWIGVNGAGTVVYHFDGLWPETSDKFVENALVPLGHAVQWKM